MDDVVIKDERTMGLVDQSQAPGNYDEVERVRQRMDGLRKHHNDSADIYNRTQPIINDQIHEETLKYLKSGQANGTKTKSQKPRAPKRQRSTATTTTTTTITSGTSSNNNNNNNNSSHNNINNNIIINNGTITNSTVSQANTIVSSTTNGLPPQPQLQQAPLPSQSIVQHGHMQPITIYPQRNQHQQQPAMHMPQHQHQMQPQQQHFKYQTPANNIYQQPTMQHQYPTQQPQQIYSQQQQQQQLQQPPSHMHPQQIEQGHFVAQRQQQHPGLQQSQQHFAQHHNHLNGNHHLQHHHPHQSHVNHVPIISLPNDLDLNLQAGLECDIDSLIKHEMSVEGQLDFNHDLLLKLDNHFHHPHHHQHHHQ